MYKDTPQYEEVHPTKNNIKKLKKLRQLKCVMFRDTPSIKKCILPNII